MPVRKRRPSTQRCSQPRRADKNWTDRTFSKPATRQPQQLNRQIRLAAAESATDAVTVAAQFNVRELTFALMNPPDPLVTRPLHLELGCGSMKRHANSVGVDILDNPGVDVVGDALTVLRSLPDGSVTGIYSEHFLEHLADPFALMREASRVLEPGAEFRAVIPHFSNPAFYSDPTHHSFFGLYSFSYWVRESPFSRKVPHYNEPLPMKLLSARHDFKSSPPFYFRHALKKLMAAWVNLSPWTQEFYEEHLCWIMPCAEIEFILARD